MLLDRAGLGQHAIVDKFDLSRGCAPFDTVPAPLSDDVEKAVKQRLHVEVTQGYGMTESSP